MQIRGSIVVIPILLALALSGCGKKGGQLPCYSVSGTVTYKGKPIEGGQLLFIGQDEHLRAKGVPAPQGMTDANGQFRLTTYKKDDGAPAGNYGVAITWMQETSPSDDPESRSETDRLGGRYSNPEKSGLTAKVEAGDNQLPAFEVK